MKRIISLILALVLCLSLCACDGENSNAPDKSEVVAEATEAPTEAAEITTYKIGEAFGTDNVECVIKEVQWLTSEEFEEHSFLDGQGILNLDTEKLFPGYTVRGTSGFLKEKVSPYSFMFITYSLQNIGTENIVPESESDGISGYNVLPYGKMNVIFDENYVFGPTDEGFDKYIGFTAGLAVLGDPVEEIMSIFVADQVLENTDKPVVLKVLLPSSNGEKEAFFVSVR